MSFLAPNVFPGYYNVRVLDNASLSSDEVTVKVLINVTSAFPLPMNITIWTSNVTGPGQGPILFLVAGTATPSSGPSGTFVTMSGNSASGGEISVYFDDSLVAKVVGRRGSWTASFQVPNVSTGNHTIRAIDVDGRWMSIVPFIVTSPIINFSVSLLYLFGLFAAAVFLGATLFMLLAMFSAEKRNSGTASGRTLGQT
jgi:hypothetical protein